MIEVAQSGEQLQLLETVLQSREFGRRLDAGLDRFQNYRTDAVHHLAMHPLRESRELCVQRELRLGASVIFGVIGVVASVHVDEVLPLSQSDDVLVFRLHSTPRHRTTSSTIRSWSSWMLW